MSELKDQTEASGVASALTQMLERLFNWKKHPASVFYFAIPLALLAFSLVIARGVLELTINGDPWYLVISLAGVASLFFGLWPIRKQLLRSNA